jgi:hypothetical protein
MVGLLNNVPGQSPQKSKRAGLRIVEPILDLWEIPRDILHADADVARVAPALRDAYDKSHPTAILLGRKPV